MPVLLRPKRWCPLPRARHRIPKRPMAPACPLRRSRLVTGIAGPPVRHDRTGPQLHHLRRGFADGDTAAGAEQRGRTRSLDFIELQDDAIIDRLPCLGQRGKPAPSFLHGNGPQRGSVITPFSPVYEMIARGPGGRRRSLTSFPRSPLQRLVLRPPVAAAAAGRARSKRQMTNL